MDPFEYLLLFAAVILGLAISDLAVSLHRLLNAADRVKWGLLTPLAALVAFLKIVTQWWSWYGAARLARGVSFEMFITLLIGAILLFLLAAAALPETNDRGDGEINMPAYYMRVRRRFWLLFAGHFILMNAVSIWAQMQISGARLNLISPAYLIVPVALSLAFVKARWWHALALTTFAALYLTQFLGQHLAAG